MAVTWNTYYETQPLGSDHPRQGDDAIREVKEALRERFEKGHKMDLTDGTASLDGWHKDGSAVAYVTNAAPTNRPDGSTALSTDAGIDFGRLWFDNGSLNYGKVYATGGWAGFMREIARVSVQGTLAAAADIVPPIVFPRAVNVSRVLVRVGTAPTGQSFVLDVHRMGTAATDLGTIFSGTKPTIAASAFFDDKDVDGGELDTTNLALSYGDYLKIDIDQVGSTVKGADLAVTVEAVLS